jgi:hypothetical protein
MSTNFQTDFESLGLQKNYLYEILTTTFSLDNNQMVPNTASMGIRLVDNKSIKIWPYPNTTTYKNIEKCKLVVLNFVDDVYLYAIASLKGSSQLKGERVFSIDYYNQFLLNLSDEYKDISNSNSVGDSVQIAYLKQSWAIIICKATNIYQISKNDDYSKSKIMEVNLTVISYEKFKESFKLFNRAENLTLETIILSTKLNVALEKKNDLLVDQIKCKIEENIANIKRFGKNFSALKAIEHIDSYIKRLEI